MINNKRCFGLYQERERKTDRETNGVKETERNNESKRDKQKERDREVVNWFNSNYYSTHRDREEFKDYLIYINYFN